MKTYTSKISFEFPTIQSSTGLGDRRDYQPQLAVEIYKSQAAPKDGNTYALPSPSERKPATITITKDAAGSKQLSLGLADKETFFFRFNNPNGKRLPIAVKVLIDGVNVLTDATETDVRALADGNPDHTDGQNFMAVPSQTWLDGYRAHRKPNPDKPSVDMATGRSKEYVVFQFTAINDRAKKEDSIIQIIAIPYTGVAKADKGIDIVAGGEIESKIYASEHKGNEFNPKHAQSISFTATLDPACRAVAMSEASTVFVVKDQHIPAAPTSANGVPGMTETLSSASLSLADDKRPALQPARTVVIDQSSTDEAHKKVDEFFNHPGVQGPQIVHALKQVVPRRINNGTTNFENILRHPVSTIDAILKKTSNAEKMKILLDSRYFRERQLPLEYAEFVMQVLFRCKIVDALKHFQSLSWSDQRKCLALFPPNIDNFPSDSQELIKVLKVVHNPAAAPAPKRRREEDGSSEADQKRPTPKPSSPTLSPRATFLPPPAPVASQSEPQHKLRELINAEFKLNISIYFNRFDDDQAIDGDRDRFVLSVPEENEGPDAERFKKFASSLGSSPTIGEGLFFVMNTDQCRTAIEKLEEIQSGLSPRI